MVNNHNIAYIWTVLNRDSSQENSGDKSTAHSEVTLSRLADVDPIFASIFGGYSLGKTQKKGKSNIGEPKVFGSGGLLPGSKSNL